MARILLIEDDEELLTSTARLLTRKGYEVETALDGREGIDKARAQLPELIVSDIAMPELDGYAVLELLRADPRTAVIPVIFASAHGEERAIRTGMGLGADDFLVKPFRLKDLLRSIEVRLARSQEIRSRLDELYRNLTTALPHEFRTPLHGILGMANLIREAGEGDFQPGELRDFANVILRSAERLRHLVENYVLFTRLYLRNESSLASEAAIDCAVTVLPSELRMSLERLARKHGRRSDLRCSFEGALVALGASELSRLLWELGDNAFKFSSPGTPVEMKATILEGHWILQVDDEGRGMSADEVARIAPFMQFRREEYQQAGLGLGLILSRLLCESAGGSLDIEQRPDGGCRVLARLALAN